ncbi:hypothetical protein [Pseudoalteromonas sp. JC3]|uniref:hypothetical protein n=1 Tax=Pseudoalteromonas sp. JC3 TaxID=2810196 RepID=UPI0019D0807E|nr:hypothetical protein [Pseudoalteromonas sp. JC3]MBR8842314.1 hypothetical protein [Pseudoalteromonas sp. JC3]WJE09561.1 hypothetical protein QSH61_03565 [Pseudoalteromonas sp. JC3]
MASKGRTPLSALEKAKRKAARDYRRIAEKRSLTYDDIYGKRAGNKNMGRKPVSKEEQIRRAKKQFLKSLSEHRAEARKESIDLPDIKSLLREYRTYRANDSAGRKSADRYLILKKHLKKENEKLLQAQRELESDDIPCPLETYSGRGRKPMSKREKVKYLSDKVTEVVLEMEEVYKKVPESQKIYYELRDARLELRELRENLKNQKLAPFDDVLAAREELEQKVSELETAYNEQLKLEKKESKSKPLQSSTSALSPTTTPLPSVATTLSNSENEVTEELFQNRSPHQVIDNMKQDLAEVEEEIKRLELLEEVLRKKEEFIKKRKLIKQGIENIQNKII